MSASSVDSICASIARAVFGRRMKGAWMAVFSAYFDASGTAEDSTAKVLTVAGYISTDEEWSMYESEWQTVLKSYGVSALHMKHFAHSRGEFSGWKGNETRRVAFMQALSGVIGRHTIHQFSVGILLDDYRMVNHCFKLSEFAQPYWLAAQCVIADVHKWMKKTHPSENWLIVFEKGDRHQGQLIDLLRRWGNNLPVDPVFVAKKWTDEGGTDQRCRPLEASDFLAYEQCKVVTDYIRSQRRKVRGSLFALLQASNQIGVPYGSVLGFQFFELLCGAFDIHPRR